MENKTKLLYLAGVTLILGDLLPTPADAFVFYRQRKLKEKLEKGEITPRQYWIKNSVGYYTYNPLWWAFVLGTTYAVGGDYKRKRNFMLGLVASGAVFGVIYKNIKSDEKSLAEMKQERERIIKEHPELADVLLEIPEFKNITGEKLRKELEDLKKQNA